MVQMCVNQRDLKKMGLVPTNRQWAIGLVHSLIGYRVFKKKKIECWNERY